MTVVRTLAAVWTAIGMWAVVWLLFRAQLDRRQMQILSGVQGARGDFDTKNERTIGSYATDDETRRIEAIGRPQRTATEQRHLDNAPLREPAQGPDA